MTLKIKDFTQDAINIHGS